MKKSAVFALALPLLAGACMVGPDFQRPETTRTTTYTAAVDAPLPADQRLVQGDALDGNWWSEFRAPGLDAVVDQAIADNQDICGRPGARGRGAGIGLSRRQARCCCRSCRSAPTQRTPSMDQP